MQSEQGLFVVGQRAKQCLPRVAKPACFEFVVGPGLSVGERLGRSGGGSCGLPSLTLPFGSALPGGDVQSPAKGVSVWCKSMGLLGEFDEGGLGCVLGRVGVEPALAVAHELGPQQRKRVLQRLSIAILRLPHVFVDLAARVNHHRWHLHFFGPHQHRRQRARRDGDAGWEPMKVESKGTDLLACVGAFGVACLANDYRGGEVRTDDCHTTAAGDRPLRLPGFVGLNPNVDLVGVALEVVGHLRPGW